MSPKIHLKELQLPLFLFLIFVLNVLVYFRAAWTIEPTTKIFEECVRNSGRVSAGFNLLILLIVGHWGLKTIYQDRTMKKVFLLMFILFAVNHMIHLFFLTQYFVLEHREMLSIGQNKRSLITFVCVILVPIILLRFRTLSKGLYILILAHIFNVTYLMCKLFYSRYKPYDAAYIHRIGVVIMISSVLYVLYRVYAERGIKSGKEYK